MLRFRAKFAAISSVGRAILPPSAAPLFCRKSVASCRVRMRCARAGPKTLRIYSGDVTVHAKNM